MANSHRDGPIEVQESVFSSVPTTESDLPEYPNGAAENCIGG
jgi:hypothetical protein